MPFKELFRLLILNLKLTHDIQRISAIGKRGGSRTHVARLICRGLADITTSHSPIRLLGFSLKTIHVKDFLSASLRYGGQEGTRTLMTSCRLMQLSGGCGLTIKRPDRLGHVRLPLVYEHFIMPNLSAPRLIISLVLQLVAVVVNGFPVSVASLLVLFFSIEMASLWFSVSPAHRISSLTVLSIQITPAQANVPTRLNQSLSANAQKTVMIARA